MQYILEVTCFTIVLCYNFYYHVQSKTVSFKKRFFYKNRANCVIEALESETADQAGKVWVFKVAVEDSD